MTYSTDTALTAPLLTSVTIPLDPEIRAAYENLSAKYQAAFDANPDYAFRLEVRDWKTAVDNILDNDASYRSAENTALLQAILVQIQSTNTDLAKIRDEVSAIAGDFAKVGDILDAINKILTLLPA